MHILMIKLQNKWVRYPSVFKKITEYLNLLKSESPDMAQFLWLSERDFSILPLTSLLMPIQLSKMLPKKQINLLPWMSPVIGIQCWIFRKLKIVQVMPGYNGKCLLLTSLITFWFPTENGASAFTDTSHHSSVSPTITETSDCMKGELLLFDSDKTLKGDTCKLLSFRTNSCLYHASTFFVCGGVRETDNLQIWLNWAFSWCKSMSVPLVP